MPLSKPTETLDLGIAGTGESAQNNESASRAQPVGAARPGAEPDSVLTDCVLFDGLKNDRGYGVKYRPSDRKMVKAHSQAWEREHGSVPVGMHLHHRCGTRACVRVDHLLLVTPVEHYRLHGMYSREDLIAAMWGFEVKYGRQPQASDWDATKARANGYPERARRYYADGWPHYSTAVKVFGSWGAALRAAGFRPLRDCRPNESAVAS